MTAITGLQFTQDHDTARAVARYIARFGQRPNVAYSRGGKAWGGLRGEVAEKAQAGMVILGNLPIDKSKTVL